MTFQFVQPTEEQKSTMQKYCDKYQTLYEEIKHLPDVGGIALTHAMTKLEESAMWLNKAITKNEFL